MDLVHEMGIELKVFDADLHPVAKGGTESLKPYLSLAWQRYFEDRPGLPPQHALRPPLPGGSAYRRDAFTPNGDPPGTDPQYVLDTWIKPNNIEYALLLSPQSGNIAGIPNAQVAAVLARAFNDFFLNEWAEKYPMFKLAICVSPQDPIEAAKEIRRIGGHKDVVGVFLPLVNILMGTPYYYPIYEAAEEYGLPVILHPTGTEGGQQGAISFAGGIPSTYIERHTAFPQIAFAHVTSLVLEGVFERFPQLTVVCNEFGYTWVPHLMWRLDQNWRNFRNEVPWLKRPPSEYLLQHCRFTTQPKEEPEKEEYLYQIFEMMHADQILLFSTDYPHWDIDRPITTFINLDEQVKRRIFYENARKVYKF